MTPLLEARALTRIYRRQGRRVRALDGVSALMPKGETTALVGRSGSGKSSLARCLALLESPDEGEVLLEGRATGGPSNRLSRAQLAAARRSVQLVVQDPIRAVNPRFTVLEAVGEPLQIAGVDRSARRLRVEKMLTEVELDPGLLDRPVRRLSGGQIQRLVLARALACDPRALILDEAMSGLDLAVRSRLIKLLEDLQSRRQLTYVLLSHDRALVARMARRGYELEAGRIVRSWSD